MLIKWLNNILLLLVRSKYNILLLLVRWLGHILLLCKVIEQHSATVNTVIKHIQLLLVLLF